MQGKGFVKTFAIILGLACLFILSHTFYTQRVESRATQISQAENKGYQETLDSLAQDTLNLLLTKYNYYDSKQKELNLGLDLKGGINVTLQISIKDLLNELSQKSKNASYRRALELTDEEIRNSDESYLELFFNNFDELKNANGGKPNLADYDIFGNKKNVDIININMSDDEVKSVLRDNVEASINTAYEVFSTRIDRFGVTQPNIQRIPGTGRILIELPGAKNIDRIKKLLQTSARLEFWRVHSPSVPIGYIRSIPADSIGGTKLIQLLNIEKVSNGEIKTNGAFGAARVVDTAAVNKLLNTPQAKDKRLGALSNARFLWGSKPDPSNPEYIGLFCIDDVSRKGEPLLDDAVSSANFDYDQFGGVVVDMQMDAENATKWKDVTTKYVGNQIAIVLDNLVYSAPNVNEPIPSGRSQISGNFTQAEAKDLADALQSGKLPATAKIVQADVVGPSLGLDSINAGMLSFTIAFICILLWMIFYYGRAGSIADIALVINMFYIIGIFAAWKFVLTLPGIAGLVLTLGIAVDANIITYERVKEELKKGKGVKEAYEQGWKHALSAIIDGNVTTLLTAIILFVVGSGPVKGFATTLGIGIISTLFTALLLSRVFIENRLSKGKSMSFWTSVTKNWFSNVKFDWMGKRKVAYIISGILTVVCIISLATRGLNLGVDFSGGRTYTVKYEKPAETTTLKQEITATFPEDNGVKSNFDVKTFGTDNQVKITTKYKYNDDGVDVDPEIESLLYKSFQKYLPQGYSLEQFKAGEGYGLMSYSKVGPTIADDIQKKGSLAVGASLVVIFLYILWRFKKWQFSLGAVTALFHDSIFVLGMYSLLYGGLLPFSLEIDQSFIAAILTVIGYSINDTVIVFDRIRENMNEHPSMDLKELVNLSINQTLGRTFNTSATTLFVILIIFIFGGENLRGFMFALLLGIGIGTYSSVYIASAIMYDLLKRKNPSNKVGSTME